jgi:hypothetical protein
MSMAYLARPEQQQLLEWLDGDDLIASQTVIPPCRP